MRKITPEQYEQWLAENRPEITALEPYQRNNVAIAHDCGNGHVWVTKPAVVKAGRGCGHCSGQFPIPYTQWLAENRPELTAIEAYVNAHTKIMHQCDKGHEAWPVSPTSIKTGSGCPHCDAESKGIAPRGFRTEEMLIESARPFQQITRWYEACSAEYHAAWKMGVLDKCTAHMDEGRAPNGYWTLERCSEIALQYETISDWARGHGASYHAAHKQGFIPECSAHMVCGHQRFGDGMRKWTRDACVESAQPFQFISDWIEAHPGAYNAARQGGWCDECTAHMETTGRGSANDAVYCWMVTAANDEVVVPIDGHHLVKFGTTSQRRGEGRPMETMRNNSMQGEIIAICDTSAGGATKVEGVLLTLGTDAGVPYWYDGYTEFRLIDDEELSKARALLGA